MENVEFRSIKELSNNECIDVSIIIRTRNEEQFIEKCIKKINNQKTSYKYEIIIIDSESTDKTIEIATKYKVRILSISSKDFNFGTSINLGVSMARGKYCVFLSAHALPENNEWLEKLVYGCNQDKVVASYSRQTYDKDADIIEARGLKTKFGFRNRIQNFDDFIRKYKRSPKTFLEYRNYITFSNASSCIKREVALSIPFKKIIASEDREWALRVIRAGYSIAYISDSIVMHYHNENIDSWYKRIYINAYATNEFSGYKFKKILKYPIICINTLRDLNFLLNEGRDIKILTQFKISIKYWNSYCKAFYEATNLK